MTLLKNNVVNTHKKRIHLFHGTSQLGWSGAQLMPELAALTFFVEP